MSCSADTMALPAAALSGPNYFNACTAVNITDNSAAQSAMTKCCGSAPITVFADCYSYCNVTSSADQQTFEKCFGGSDGVSDIDYACTLDDNPLSASGSAIPATAGSTYLGGSSGTLVFPSATDSSTAAASTTGTVTTTATSGQATASANPSNSASGTSKGSTSGHASASATSSGASASSTAKSGQPSVKQFSKGAVAILALAFVGLLI